MKNLKKVHLKNNIVIKIFGENKNMVDEVVGCLEQSLEIGDTNEITK